MNPKDNQFNSLADEWTHMPLKFSMEGSKFRYELLKMAFASQRSTFNIHSLIKDAEVLKDWVNNEQKMPTI